MNHGFPVLSTYARDFLNKAEGMKISFAFAGFGSFLPAHETRKIVPFLNPVKFVFAVWDIWLFFGQESNVVASILILLANQRHVYLLNPLRKFRFFTCYNGVRSFRDRLRQAIARASSPSGILDKDAVRLQFLNIPQGCVRRVESPRHFQHCDLRARARHC